MVRATNKCVSYLGLFFNQNHRSCSICYINATVQPWKHFKTTVLKQIYVLTLCLAWCLAAHALMQIPKEDTCTLPETKISHYSTQLYLYQLELHKMNTEEILYYVSTPKVIVTPRCSSIKSFSRILALKINLIFFPILYNKCFW